MDTNTLCMLILMKMYHFKWTHMPGRHFFVLYVKLAGIYVYIHRCMYRHLQTLRSLVKMRYKQTYTYLGINSFLLHHSQILNYHPSHHKLNLSLSLLPPCPAPSVSSPLFVSLSFIRCVPLSTGKPQMCIEHTPFH